MNKVMVREVTRRESTYGFELERQEDQRGGGGAHRRGVSGAESGAKDDPVGIVILCESEDLRDQWLKIINDQIRELKDIARKLENPQSFDQG